MTFREKLADWISGGALSDERERADMCRDLYHDACDYDEQLEDMAASMEYAFAKSPRLKRRTRMRR